MNKQYLRYAIRGPVVLKYFGQLCIAMGSLTIVPLGVSLFFGDFHITLRYGMVMGGLIGFGGLMANISAPIRVQANEGMVIVALTFLMGPLIMAFPMMGAGLTFSDAVFEAISGITTTGLSTLPTLENLPSTFLFARAWMQWYGGLGIVVLSLALLTSPGPTAKGLAVTEEDADDLVGSMRMHARRVIMVYSFLTLMGLLALWMMGLSFFETTLYIFSAISTGGFAPLDNSLVNLHLSAQATILFFSLLGAIPLALYHQLYMKKWHRSTNLPELRTFLFTTILLGTLFGGSLWTMESGSLNFILEQASLMAISAQTTAGFSTIDLSILDPVSKLSLIPAMILGGASGSTAGGIKIIRILIVVYILYLYLVKTGLAKHAIIEPNIGKQPLGKEEIQNALLYILLFLGIIFFSWLTFVFMGYDPLDALFDVVSATSTAGLSVGVTGPELPLLLKGVLCADMLLGRLEIFAWLVLIYPGTWWGRRPETK